MMTQAVPGSMILVRSTDQRLDASAIASIIELLTNRTCYVPMLLGKARDESCPVSGIALKGQTNSSHAE